MPQTRRRRYRARGRRWAANEPIKQTINQSSSELCLFILLFFLKFFPLEPFFWATQFTCIFGWAVGLPLRKR